MKENYESILLYGLLIMTLAGLTFSTYSLLKPNERASDQVSGNNAGMPRISMMGMTDFDKDFARDFMDEDGDGMCDFCGMRIDDCIASGMMQCSMDQNAKIGVLSSQHIHADWKIYLDGKVLDLAPYAHMQRMREGKSVSSFIHVDSGSPEPERTGDVLHMHATGVPLSMFFESLGMKLTNDCLEVSGEKYCNDSKNSPTFYVNGKTNSEYGNYIFTDLDKILISYGPRDLHDSDVSAQIASINNFAGNH